MNGYTYWLASIMMPPPAVAGATALANAGFSVSPQDIAASKRCWPRGADFIAVDECRYGFRRRQPTRVHVSTHWRKPLANASSSRAAGGGVRRMDWRSRAAIFAVSRGVFVAGRSMRPYIRYTDDALASGRA